MSKQALLRMMPWGDVAALAVTLGGPLAASVLVVGNVWAGIIAFSLGALGFIAWSLYFSLVRPLLPRGWRLDAQALLQGHTTAVEPQGQGEQEDHEQPQAGEASSGEAESEQ